MENNYRQYLAAKALFYAMNGEEGKSEAIRFFLRKNMVKEIAKEDSNEKVIYYRKAA